MTVSVENWQNQNYDTRDKLHQLQHNQKNGNVRKRHSTKLRSNVITQWAVTNHMLFRLYYTTRGTVYLPWVYTTPSTRLYGQLMYAMNILFEWRTPDLDLVYQVLFLYIHKRNSHIRVYMNICSKFCSMATIIITSSTIKHFLLSRSFSIISPVLNSCVIYLAVWL